MTALIDLARTAPVDSLVWLRDHDRREQERRILLELVNAGQYESDEET